MGYQATILKNFSQIQFANPVYTVSADRTNADELTAAMQLGDVASVKNMYGYAQRTTINEGHRQTRGGEVLPLCEQHGIPFIPFFSLVQGLAKTDDKLTELARQRGVTAAHLNIAWLLHQSPVLLPVPGTSSLMHLRENLAAATIELSAADMAYLG